MRIILKLIMAYITKNKIMLKKYLIKNRDKHLSVSEIHEGMKKENIVIPYASLYRILSSLENEKFVRKYELENNQSACYQYIGDESHHHFHLICKNCHKVIHLECEDVDDLISHIRDELDFQVDISKVNLYGICNECKGK